MQMYSTYTLHPPPYTLHATTERRDDLRSGPHTATVNKSIAATSKAVRLSSKQPVGAVPSQDSRPGCCSWHAVGTCARRKRQPLAVSSEAKQARLSLLLAACGLGRGTAESCSRRAAVSARRRVLHRVVFKMDYHDQRRDASGGAANVSRGALFADACACAQLTGCTLHARHSTASAVVGNALGKPTVCCMYAKPAYAGRMSCGMLYGRRSAVAVPTIKQTNNDTDWKQWPHHQHPAVRIALMRLASPSLVVFVCESVCVHARMRCARVLVITKEPGHFVVGPCMHHTIRYKLLAWPSALQQRITAEACDAMSSATDECVRKLRDLLESQRVAAFACCRYGVQGIARVLSALHAVRGAISSRATQAASLRNFITIVPKRTRPALSSAHRRRSSSHSSRTANAAVSFAGLR
jgi:hypothetical protein